MSDRYADVTACEHRPDRAHNVRDASTLMLPNGTLLASCDVGFLVAATRAVYALHRGERS